MAQPAHLCCSRTLSVPIAVNRGSVREACSVNKHTQQTRAQNPRIPRLPEQSLGARQRIHLSYSSAALRSSNFQTGLGQGSLHNTRQHVRLNAASEFRWLLTIPLASAGFWGEITSNVIFMAGFWGWAAAQIAKIFTCYAKKGIWDVTQVVSAGGMPSSHSSLCMAVTTAIGMQHGFGSSLFAMALCFSLIVMYDAAGVRRQAGAQAEVLNTVVRELLSMHVVSQKKLKEVLGHTPLQVFMGAILGCVCGTAYTCYVGA